MGMKRRTPKAGQGMLGVPQDTIEALRYDGPDGVRYTVDYRGEVTETRTRQGTRTPAELWRMAERGELRRLPFDLGLPSLAEVRRMEKRHGLPRDLWLPE